MWFLMTIVFCLGFHTVLVKGACTKFTSKSELDKSVMVQGRCVYGFRNIKAFDTAKNLCESERTQLIVLKTVDEQEAAWIALGPDFTQHWMGLKQKDNEWKWKDGGFWIPMTSPRWENGQTGVLGYAASSANRFLWGKTSSRDRYRPVCEEYADTTQAVPTTTVTTQAVTTPTVTTQAVTTPTVTTPTVTTQAVTTPTVTTQAVTTPPVTTSTVTTQAVTTPTVTTPTVTTQAFPTQAVHHPVFTGDLMFRRVDVLESVSIIDSISVANIRYCVLRCLGRPDCTDIVYKSSTPNCILTKHDPSGDRERLVCSDNNKCFTTSIQEDQFTFFVG